jgi:hypothetical protein
MNDGTCISSTVKVGANLEKKTLKQKFFAGITACCNECDVNKLKNLVSLYFQLIVYLVQFHVHDLVYRKRLDHALYFYLFHIIFISKYFMI